MNKFDLNTAKFVSIIVGICFIFVMVIWHAYDYLPQEAQVYHPKYSENENIIQTNNADMKKTENKAQQAVDSGDYALAVEEYKNTILATNDTKIQAECYENIAIIYGMFTKYDSAMIAAQKAYDLYPTISKEILLARLHSKAGDKEKAIEILNDILDRDIKIND